MKLTKVLKRLREEEKKSGHKSEKPITYTSLQNSNTYHNNGGFQTKGSSTTGASRQRSIGNRNTKPSKSK